MAFLPVAHRELIAAAHRRGTYRLRWGVALSAAGMAALFFLMGNAGRSQGAGLFGIVGSGCLVLASLAGVFLTSDAIAAEHRDGTLGLLYLTELGPLDVLLGKLVALGINAACAVLAVFPVLAVAWLLGGITGAEMLRYLLVELNVLFVSLSIGLGVSAWFQSQGAAVGVTSVALASLFAWEYLVTGLFPYSFLAPDLGALSPWVGVVEAGALNYRPQEFWKHLALGHLTGWIAVGLSAFGLRRAWRGGTPIVAQTSTANRRQRARPLESAVDSLPQMAVGRLLAVSLWPPRLAWCLVSLAGGVYVVFALWTGVESATGSYLLAATLSGLVLKGLFAWESVYALAEARRTGALELLLCTPVSDGDISSAHARYLSRAIGRPILALYALDALVCVAAPGDVALRGLLPMSGIGALLTFMQCRAMILGGRWWGIREERSTMAFAKNFFWGTALSILLMWFCCLGLAVPLVVIAWLGPRVRRSSRDLLVERGP